MANAGALVSVNPEDILTRYEQGEMIPEQAKSLGVTHQAIYRFLLAKAPDKWREYQTARVMHEYEMAKKRCEEAPDALALARAREGLRAAQWELERLCRRLYGQDQPPASGNAVQININLRSADATTHRSNGQITVDGNTLEAQVTE